MLAGACKPNGLGANPDLAALARQAEERAASAWPADEPVSFGLDGWMLLADGERVTVTGALVRQGEDYRLDTRYQHDGSLRHAVALVRGGRGDLFLLYANLESSWVVRDGGSPDLALRWFESPILAGGGARLLGPGTLDGRPTWSVSLEEGGPPAPRSCVIPTVLAPTGTDLAVLPGARCHPAASLATRWTAYDLDAESLQLAGLSGWQAARGGERQAMTLCWSGHMLLAPERWSPTTLEVRIGDQTVAEVHQTPLSGPPPSLDQVDVKRELMLEAQANGDEAFFAQPRDWTAMLMDTIAPAREQELPSATVLEMLSLAEGERVADIGAGAGFLTFAMARAVGPRGEVVAVDILPQAVAILGERAKDREICPFANVRPVLSTFSDPKLMAESVDTLVMCGLDFQRYPLLSDAREELLRRLFEACRPGGRLELLDKPWSVSDEPPVGFTTDMLQIDSVGPVVGGVKWEWDAHPQYPYRAQLRANVEAVGFVYQESRPLPDVRGDWEWFMFRKPAP